METQEQEARPLYAELSESGNGRSFAQLVLWDKPVELMFTGVNHEEDAQLWANEWNEHLDREWCQVRAAGVTMMEAYRTALAARGVGTGVLDAALKDIANCG